PAAPTPATPPAATPSPAKPSDTLPPAVSAARRAFLAPAHASGGTGLLPVSAACAEPSLVVTELQITPQTLGFTAGNQHTTKPLSRRDRRRLRRLAASK